MTTTSRRSIGTLAIPAIRDRGTTKNEWLGLVDVAGLEVEALYGDFRRRPFDDASREYVFVARRRR